MKILLISDGHTYAIGHVFAAALKSLNHEVQFFDLHSSVNSYIRLGKAGKLINNFLPVEAWLKKGNRELAVKAKNFAPEQIIISGHVQILYGTLAFIKSILPKTRITLYWPDPLINLNQSELNIAPFVDHLVSYSRRSLDVFKQMGFKNTAWMPFAGDPHFLGITTAVPTQFEHDISFIGGWRPEREKAISVILKNIPGISCQVMGTDWNKNVKSKEILGIVNNTPLYGKAYGDFIRRSRINLNVIDETNFPAANMRFFEIPVAGGLELSSSCPEMEDVFIANQHIHYYKNDLELCEAIQRILRNEKEASRVREAGFTFANHAHTYADRVNTLLG